MARKSSIWWNESKRAFFTTIKGKQERLAENRDEAEAAYHRLMILAGRASVAEKRNATLPETVDAFLISKEDRNPKTLKSYKYYMQPFVEHFRHKKLEDITPSEIRSWVNNQKPRKYVVKGVTRLSKAWDSVTTRHHAVAHVKMLYRWAREEGYIESNQMYALQNPYKSQIRNRAMTRQEYEAIIAATMPQDDAFRFLMRVLWEGGVRPNEACILRADHLHATRNLITLDVKEHKTGTKSGKVREIFVNEHLMRALRERAKLVPDGPLLLNYWGRPWRPGTILQRFNRLRELGIIPKDVVPYTSRHGFVTRAIDAGIPLPIVSKLMGHESSHITEKNYHNPILDKYVDQLGTLDTPQPEVDPATELALALSILRKHGLIPDSKD